MSFEGHYQKTFSWTRCKCFPLLTPPFLKTVGEEVEFIYFYIKRIYCKLKDVRDPGSILSVSFTLAGECSLYQDHRLIGWKCFCSGFQTCWSKTGRFIRFQRVSDLGQVGRISIVKPWPKSWIWTVSVSLTG